MGKTFKEKIAALFNEADSDNSTYNISMAKLFIWLAVMTMVSSLTPFIYPGSYTLVKTFVTLIILVFATVRPALRWAISTRKNETL